MVVAKVINGTSKPRNVKVSLLKTDKKLIIYILILVILMKTSVKSFNWKNIIIGIFNLNSNKYQFACVLTHNLFGSEICYLITECIPGYTGLNCTSICPYPTYGDRCQGYCDCTNDMCDVSMGCLRKGICYHRLYHSSN